MKGAKELADMLRTEAGRCTEVHALVIGRAGALDIAAHLDAKAAIDSAVTGEVEKIAAEVGYAKEQWHTGNPKVVDGVFEWVGSLLAIVQRQAGENGILRTQEALKDADRARLTQELDAARAEVERMKACPSHRNNLPVAVVGCSECVACLQLALAWANERIRQKHAADGETILKLRAEANEQRERAEVLARGLAAYRVGGFTAGQVWENGEGKAVPR